MNEELLKSLNGAIDAAISELAAIDSLAKSDVSLQDAKLRPETANGTLPGDNRGDSTLKPEDAKKAEEAAKGENPFADKDKNGKDDKDEKKDKKSDDDDDDLDDDKAEKMKAKIKKYEDDKAAKAASCDPTMSKAEFSAVEELKKSMVEKVEALHKSFGDRLSQLEGMIEKLVKAPQPRQSISGLAPLAKSEADVQPAGAAPAAQMTKGQALDKLFDLQKSGDARVDSTVIARVDMNDFSVLAERGINLK